MAATLGHEADALAFLTALEQAPYKFDFYQTLRRLECLYAPRPRWGEAPSPGHEPVRFGQDPELSFAPAPLGLFEPSRGTRPARLQVRLFGLMGPNGPLPIHITEYARERMRHAGDPTLARFLDVLQHRFIEFFYRAWAQAQPHVNHDRPDDDRFTIYVGSFIGLSQEPFRHRDSVPDLAKFHHAGVLIRHPRSATGLQAILQHFFRVPVRLQEFVGHWMELPVRERSRLGAESAALGSGAVLGARVWDRQHKFRIHLGPLSREQYAAFLPGGTLLRQLVDWVRLYLTFELEWDVRLVLAGRDVPSLRLGSGARLGWTTWLGRRTNTGDAGDLCLNAEAFVARTTPAAGAGVRGYQTP